MSKDQVKELVSRHYAETTVLAMKALEQIHMIFSVPESQNALT